jgi:hypothetical protein
MTTKNAKSPQNVPKCHEIHIAKFPIQCPKKYTHIGILGMQIYHLATMLRLHLNFTEFWASFPQTT